MTLSALDRSKENELEDQDADMQIDNTGWQAHEVFDVDDD